MTDLKTALRAAVEALPGATKGPYATHLVDDTLLVGGNGIEVASAVGSYENDSEAYQMTRNMAFLSTAANLSRHAPALLAMVEENERLQTFFERITKAAEHITHYAYGRTPDEQLGQVVFTILRDYRAALGAPDA